MFGSTNPFGQSSSSPFGSPSVFGQPSSQSSNPFAPKPFGSSNTFGSQAGSSIFGTSTGVFGTPSSTPAFGASSSPAFGSSMPAFGASSTPAFGSSTSSFCSFDIAVDLLPATAPSPSSISVNRSVLTASRYTSPMLSGIAPLVKREREMRAATSLFLCCRRRPIVLVRPSIIIRGSNNPPMPIALFFSINLNNNSNNNIHIYPHHYHHRQSYSCSNSPLFFSSISSSQSQNQAVSESKKYTSKKLQEDPTESECDNSSNNDASDVFRRWGCSEEQLGLIQLRWPALLRMKPSSLESKLHILRGLDILPPDLIRIVTCRPRFLFSRIGHGLEFLRTLFPSDSDLLRKAILCNPSLLNYKVEETMRPCVHLYESMDISRYDLGRLLISRPTIIPRSSLSPDKLDLIRRTPLCPTSPLYKYVVSIVAISHIETIHAKIANLEKFGFSFDQVMSLFARSPNVLTLSVDKVQRNMTYILGIINLPPSSVLHLPLLLYANLDTHLKPRYLLGLKLQEMGLRPQITGLGPSPSLFKALRMKEPRFLKAFILCHKDKEVTESLMEFYTSVKVSRRLAESCRKVVHKGFPF